MNTEIMPASIAPPAANYAHAMLVEQPSRWLHTSGVVAIAVDGTVPETIAEQADLIWHNIGAMLAEADMTAADIVNIVTYVAVDEIGSLATVMAARDRAIGTHRAASTLITVPQLARPKWKMEIAVIAAR